MFDMVRYLFACAKPNIEEILLWVPLRVSSFLNSSPLQHVLRPDCDCLLHVRLLAYTKLLVVWHDCFRIAIACYMFAMIASCLSAT